MLRLPDRSETAAETHDDFEWANVWAAQSVAECKKARIEPSESNVVPLRVVAETPDTPPGTAMETQARPAGVLKRERDYQVVLDIVAITHARDALIDAPVRDWSQKNFDAIPLRRHRTKDSVPVILGSVIGLLMIIVFSTAAAFVRLAR